MGLHDRDWYWEAIDEKNKKPAPKGNQNLLDNMDLKRFHIEDDNARTPLIDIDKIWNNEGRTNNKKKKSFGHLLLQLSPIVITILFIFAIIARR